MRALTRWWTTPTGVTSCPISSTSDRISSLACFDQIALELFDLSMLPIEESSLAVTEAYALSKLLNVENYLLPPVSAQGKKNTPMTKERGDSKTQLAHNLYLLGITHKRKLKQSLSGGAPADKETHDGGRSKQIYGFQFDFFVELANMLEACLIQKGNHTYLKSHLSQR
jgi:hypothetical protein